MGNVPFHPLHKRAFVTKFVGGVRPEVPANAPAATHKSGLLVIVQSDAGERNPLNVLHFLWFNNGFLSLEMWDTGLGKSTSTGGYVSIPEQLALPVMFTTCQRVLAKLRNGLILIPGMGRSAYVHLERSVFLFLAPVNVVRTSPKRSTAPGSAVGASITLHDAL